MINRDLFYTLVKTTSLFKKLSQKQVDSINLILDRWDRSGEKDNRRLAYIFATIYHETGATMLPIDEWGKGKGYKYGQQIKRSGVPYITPKKLYYGRGFVQLTWYENYENMSRLIYGDNRLLVDPELAKDPKVATEILFEGMFKGASSFGDFTGRCLEMYFNETTEDPEGARAIINGKDKKKLIAGYYKIFLSCIV